MWRHRTGSENRLFLYILLSKISFPLSLLSKISRDSEHFTQSTFRYSWWSILEKPHEKHAQTQRHILQHGIILSQNGG
jgi:hypothetical protein